MRKKTFIVAALSVTASVVAGACGSDSDEQPTASAGAAAVAGAGGEAAGDGAAPNAGGDGSSATPGSSDGGSGGDADSPPLHHESYRASTGFASTQGANGWYYRQFDGASYADMIWDDAASRWQGTDEFCIIGRTFMHPDVHQPVREWKAPFAGTVTIDGSMERPSLPGDGTRARITKNRTQIWPSSDWQLLSPRFVARHLLTTTVRAGDTIGFYLDRNGEPTDDTTNWDPVISYNTSPRFTLDKADIVMDPAALDAMGIETMDVSLSTLPGTTGTGNVWFHSERFGNDHQKFSGPLDHPGTTLLFEKAASDYFNANPSGADGQWWLTNLYQAPEGDLLGFVHVEKSGGSDKYRLGLAYSANAGDSWTYLGHVIGQYSDPDGANISGTPYFVKDGYFYIYYADMSPTGGIAAVARAPVGEVLSAARQGKTSPWHKYLSGAWNSDGLGGMASAIALPTVSLHSDAAYSATKRVYMLTGYNHGPGRGVWIAFSSDGVTYSPGDWLQHSDDPKNQTLSPYITLVDVDGTDNAEVGDAFYAYWAFAPRWDELANQSLRYLVRQRVELRQP